MKEENQKIYIGVPIEATQSSPVIQAETLSDFIGVNFFSPKFKLNPEHCEQFSLSTYLDQTYSSSELRNYEDGLVEGFYLVSLMDALKKCAYRDDDNYIGLNYGSNRLRFISPVTIDDTLLFTCNIQSVSQKNRGLLVELNCELKKPEKNVIAVLYSMMYMLVAK